MPTPFCLDRLDITMSDGTPFSFFFDGNGKITRENGTFARPVSNAFSLIQVEDCPFATPICKSVCYVHRLEKAEVEIHAAYVQNSRVIREVLGNDEYFLEVTKAFSEWIESKSPKGFRWHVSGDIISNRHAEFIAQVCRITPQVPFWIYTRSFPLLLPLLSPRILNLALNLSADKDNYEDVLLLHRTYGLRICYLTIDGNIPINLPKGSVIFPNHELRGRDLPHPTDASWCHTLTYQQKQMVCPPDFFGQSESLRCGPCKKCLR